MKRKPISATYINTYTQCLQKFYFKYHTKKQPVISGQARAFGIAVHEALELMYHRLSNTGRLPTEEDYDEVYKEFLRSGLSFGLSDQELYDEGRTLLKSRLDSYTPEEKILGLELRFGFPYDNPKLSVCTKGGTPLTGAIDKLIELDSDTIVVADYKTSRTALTDVEAATDAQLSLYDLVASILYPQYKNIIIVLDYLRLRPVITHRTEEQRSRFSEFVDTLYEQVDALEESKIKPRLNEYCGWCDYRSYCSSYNQIINDPDMLVKPLETYDNDGFVDEWVRLNNIRRAVESYRRDLSMHAANIIHDTGKPEIVGNETTLYKVQSSRVYYNASTILSTIPKNDCSRLLNVNKSAVDKYLVDHPEYAEDVSNTARVSFASSFFKQKKTKK